ncbi:hypothetical protein OIU77_022902 [Salix suchowensis]|uniref:Uncharacterized protein n=1 Tax=Salix suchowensis TaxID=1278906 RepID=A0ABQ9C1X7_9ROSI|nr:hypothetical protein OIU78_009776 [Salix suchowensis]KAJ6393556.1 hypothetical protein OIU77_022902 [Salix suchowensis]
MEILYGWQQVQGSWSGRPDPGCGGHWFGNSIEFQKRPSHGKGFALFWTPIILSCSWSHAFSSGLMHCMEAMVIEAKWDSIEYSLFLVVACYLKPSQKRINRRGASGIPCDYISPFESAFLHDGPIASPFMRE